MFHKLVVLVVLIVSFQTIVSLRGPGFSSNLYLFQNNETVPINETICGGILLTQFHLLTTKLCGKNIKKYALAPKSLSDLDTDTLEENIINEIYLEPNKNAAIILLANPEPFLQSRRGRKRQAALKIDSTFSEFNDQGKTNQSWQKFYLYSLFRCGVDAINDFFFFFFF